MNAVIRDRTALGALDPAEVAAYLRTTGWEVRREEPGKFAFWEKPSGEADPFEVLLAVDRGYSDYATRMAELVATLGTVEKRSQLKVYRDLRTSADDIVRFRLLAAETQDGTVPIEQGVHLFHQAHQVCLAGASANARPREAYIRSVPRKVIDFVRTRFRFGQTEIGSYVVTVMSRVTPELRADEGDTSHAPLERQVTTTLARALGRTSEAAQAVAGDRLRPFQEAVADGVTANLCTALADLVGDSGPIEGVSVEFSWSRARPQHDKSVPSTVFIPQSSFGAIREAGDKLKSFQPYLGADVAGTVSELRAPDAQYDLATVRVVIDNRLRAVRVRVMPQFRPTVIYAFRDRTRIRCLGDIVNDGQHLVMDNPTAIVPAD